jgi:hypothetical protein
VSRIKNTHIAVVLQGTFRVIRNEVEVEAGTRGRSKSRRAVFNAFFFSSFDSWIRGWKYVCIKVHRDTGMVPQVRSCGIKMRSSEDGGQHVIGPPPFCFPIDLRM